MAWYSVLAIYLLFWTVTLFVVLPVGVRTSEEEGEKIVPGQEAGAPHRVSMWRKAMWTTIISAFFFGLFYLNWEKGWIGYSHMERLMNLIFGI